MALLSLPLGVSTFSLRETLREDRAAGGDRPPALRALLSLWTRCLLIGVLGGVLALGAARPASGWPFAAAAATLLLLHAPRSRLFHRPPG
jgi:hypothetical protein